MLVAAAATYGAATSPVLGFRTLAIDGTRFTSQEAIRGALGVGPDTNLVGLATDALRGRLVALPTVRDASVGVSLPDTIRVSVVERVPLLAWAVGEQRFLVDENGHVFAALPAGGADPAAPLPTLAGVSAPSRRATSKSTGSRAAPTAIALAAARWSVTTGRPRTAAATAGSAPPAGNAAKT